MTRADVFKTNLHELMKIHNLDEWTVKAAFDLAGRKWFDRVYYNGLERDNIKAAPRINQLKQIFKLPTNYNFWQPTLHASEFISQVQNLMIQLGQSERTAEWNELVDEIRASFKRWHETIANWQEEKPM